MHDWRETLGWYDDHQTADEIGFDPDGMCLKICRTARDIPARYPDAKTSQDNTPKEYRVYDVAKLRRGMVLYFDDPNDSNRFGHIVTMIGRVKGFKDWSNLDDVLVETNSVVANQVVIVRASYFKQHWGDDFKFGATWLNGFELDVPAKKTQPRPRPEGPTRVENFMESRPNWDVNILRRAVTNGREDLRPIVDGIDKAVKSLPDDKDEDDSLVEQFKDVYREKGILRAGLINQAVVNGRTGEVKAVRDELRRLIKSLPNY